MFLTLASKWCGGRMGFPVFTLMEGPPFPPGRYGWLVALARLESQPMLPRGPVRSA